jgi:hypothetical protein
LWELEIRDNKWSWRRKFNDFEKSQISVYKKVYEGDTLVVEYLGKIQIYPLVYAFL